TPARKRARGPLPPEPRRPHLIWPPKKVGAPAADPPDLVPRLAAAAHLKLARETSEDLQALGGFGVACLRGPFVPTHGARLVRANALRTDLRQILSIESSRELICGVAFALLGKMHQEEPRPGNLAFADQPHGGLDVGGRLGRRGWVIRGPCGGRPGRRLYAKHEGLPGLGGASGA